MEAILKNGGIRNCKNDIYPTLVMFNAILDIVELNDDAETLISHLDRYRHKIRKRRTVFPFNYGVISDGVAIYQDGRNEILIFVPCETDIEL